MNTYATRNGSISMSDDMLEMLRKAGITDFTQLKYFTSTEILNKINELFKARQKNDN